MQCNYAVKSELIAKPILNASPKETTCLCDCKLVKCLLTEERRKEAKSCNVESSSSVA